MNNFDPEMQDLLWYGLKSEYNPKMKINSLYDLMMAVVIAEFNFLDTVARPTRLYSDWRKLSEDQKIDILSIIRTYMHSFLKGKEMDKYKDGLDQLLVMTSIKNKTPEQSIVEKALLSDAHLFVVYAMNLWARVSKLVDEDEIRSLIEEEGFEYDTFMDDYDDNTHRIIVDKYFAILTKKAKEFKEDQK